MAVIMKTRITHWMPIVTFCPVNKLPDLIYISITTKQFLELYAVRKKLRKLIQWKLMYMEDVAKVVYDEIPEATSVDVKLMFNKHHVNIRNRIR